MQLRRRCRVEIFRTVALAAGAAMAAFAYAGAPAFAQGYFPWDISDEPQIESARESKRASQPRRVTPRKKIGRAEAEKAGAPTAREAEPAIERPLFAVASIADQHVSIYNHHGLVARSAISTGMAGHSTPKGIFTIIGRERFHRSNIYSGAPMPFMQRITWSGIAMHLGVVPGHPASHGCIRLPAGFAAKLWGLTRIGERVVISPEDVTPAEFEHPLLPAPKMRVQTEGEKVAPTPDSPQTPAAAEPPLINPQKYAEQLKVKAVAAAGAAAKDLKAMSTAAGVKRQEAVRLAAELRAAEAAHASTQSKFDAATKAYEAASAAAAVRQQESALAAEGNAAEGDGLGGAKADRLAKAYEKAVAAKDAAALAKTNAGAALSDAAAKLETARTASSATDAELADAVRRLDETTAAAAAAANAEKEARRLTTAVSVLVSKKDRRIYVRQGLAHVFDAPIDVRDPETPLGTHLYVATAAKEDGNSLKWSVVSMPVRAADEQRERRKNYAWAEENAGMPWTSRWSSTPAEALERVEIAQDVRDRIAERLWKGASLIISDQPLSGETGNDGTDLTVKIR